MNSLRPITKTRTTSHLNELGDPIPSGSAGGSSEAGRKPEAPDPEGRSEGLSESSSGNRRRLWKTPGKEGYDKSIRLPEGQAARCRAAAAHCIPACPSGGAYAGHCDRDA